MKKILAVAVVLLMAASAQATLIRLDLGGNGVPAAGFVEYKASSTLAMRIADDTDRNGAGVGSETESNYAGGAWFGSTGSNIWDGRDLAVANGGPAETFSGLKDTATGLATGAALTVSNADRRNSGQAGGGDWRSTCVGLNMISGGGIQARSNAGMGWTITGLLPNTATELWIYANDSNYEGTAYTVNGVSLINPPRYSGNWTLRDLGSQKNGYGWNMSVTTDSAGTLTGWAKQDSEIRGLQIYQVPEPATMSLLVLGGIATLIRRRNRA